MSSTNPSTLVATGARNKRWRDAALLGGLFVLMAIGLIGLAAATGWEETWAQVMKLTLWEIWVLLALSLINYIFRGARWHLFAQRLGLPTHLWQDMRHFIGGFAMTVTPGRIGELIRMRWLRRETGWTFESTAPLALVDRASDLAAMGIILAVALALSTAGNSSAITVVVLALRDAYIDTRPSLLIL